MFGSIQALEQTIACNPRSKISAYTFQAGLLFSQALLELCPYHDFPALNSVPSDTCSLLTGYICHIAHGKLLQANVLTSIHMIMSVHPYHTCGKSRRDTITQGCGFPIEELIRGISLVLSNSGLKRRTI